MKLIGAGLPRTATTTQMIALEMLGLPCYHMRDMMSDFEKTVPQWRQALEGNDLGTRSSRARSRSSTSPARTTGAS